MSYVQENRPSELDVGRVRWVPSDLKRLKDAMGDGAVLHFTSVWGDVTLCDGDTEVNLNPASGINADTVEAIVTLCPQVKKITLTKHLNLKNEQMAELIEKYPEIEFVWMVRLGRYHRIASDATAYSTFHEPSETERMVSEDLEALRYVRGLKALDLGHNSLTELNFLKYFRIFVKIYVKFLNFQFDFWNHYYFYYYLSFYWYRHNIPNFYYYYYYYLPHIYPYYIYI